MPCARRRRAPPPGDRTIDSWASRATRLARYTAPRCWAPHNPAIFLAGRDREHARVAPPAQMIGARLNPHRRREGFIYLGSFWRRGGADVRLRSRAVLGRTRLVSCFPVISRSISARYTRGPPVPVSLLVLRFLAHLWRGDTSARTPRSCVAKGNGAWGVVSAHHPSIRTPAAYSP